jgi:sterol desaturase/sphingolipid hydroxylase (fatty acid hydroxylase superfamily)
MATMIDRLLYPALLALPLVLYAAIRGSVPFEIAPSLAVTPFLVVCAVLELLRPFHGPWSVRPGQKDLGRDFVYTLILLPIVMKICDQVLRPADVLAGVWPRSAPLALQVVLAVFLGELAFYWIHRLSHEREWLWQFHRKHHSVREVHWLNSGMLHIVDLFLNFFFYFLPLRLLGVPDEVFGWFLVITMTTGTLEHANVRYDSGFLKRIFNTAELHRLHHSVEEEISKRNFGKITCLWDQLFGTYLWNGDRTLALRVGVDDPEPAVAAVGAGAGAPAGADPSGAARESAASR